MKKIHQLSFFTNRRSVLLTLILSQIIYLISSFVAYIFIKVSPMFFGQVDPQPYSMQWLIVMTAAAFPITTLVSFLSWIPFSKANYTTAVIINFLPLFVCILFILEVIILGIVTSL